MATIPPPEHSTWQHGKQTDWFTREQVLEYGRACASEAQAACSKEGIPLRLELASYREREKTMGWSRD